MSEVVGVRGGRLCVNDLKSGRRGVDERRSGGA